MFSLGIYKNVRNVSLRRLKLYKTIKNDDRTRTLHHDSVARSVFLLSKNDFGQFRSYSNEAEEQSVPRIPKLMDIPEVIMPGLFKVVCNLYVIWNYLGRDFNISEFSQGSREAVCIVSSALSNEDYDSLNGLVTDEAIEVLRKRISTLSPEEKEQILIKRNEIVSCVPYEITIRHEEREDVRKRILEIMMIFYVIRGFQEDVEQKITMQSLPQLEQKYFLCNYRFVRELGDDCASPWMIDAINYFRTRKN